MYIYNYIIYYYMAELDIRSVREMTHADWLPSRAINFRIDRQVLALKFLSSYEDKPDSGTFYKRFSITTKSRKLD